MVDVKIDFAFQRISFVPITGSNYFHQLDHLQKVNKIIIELYGDLFNLDDDTRLKFDKK